MTPQVQNRNDLINFYSRHLQEEESGTAWWNQTRLVKAVVGNKTCIEMRTLNRFEVFLQVITFGFYRADSKQSVIDASKEIGNKELERGIMQIFQREFAPEYAYTLLSADKDDELKKLPEKVQKDLAYKLVWEDKDTDLKKLLEKIPSLKTLESYEEYPGVGQISRGLTISALLLRAVEADKLGVVKVLCENGADVNNVLGRGQKTLVNRAIIDGKLEILKYLIDERKAIVSEKDLYDGLEKDNLNVIEYIVTKLSNITSEGRRWSCACAAVLIYESLAETDKIGKEQCEKIIRLMYEKGDVLKPTEWQNIKSPELKEFIETLPKKA